MQPFDTNVLNEPETVRSMLVRTLNDITRLRVNNVYLETLKSKQTNERNAYELASQLKKNRADIREMEDFAAFLKKFAEVVQIGAFSDAQFSETHLAQETSTV